MEQPSVPADERGFALLLDDYTAVLSRGRPFVMLFELGVGVPMTGSGSTLGRASEQR